MDSLLKNHADCLSGKHLDQNGETSENGGLLRRRKEFHDMHALHAGRNRRSVKKARH